MSQPPDPFLVVGLGASAGGLGALEAFFAGLPKTDGAAFVVVIHLAPDRESELAEILARSVPLPFVQVTERVRVERGHVYVIPPDRNLLMADGHLDVAPLEDARHQRRPIDHFFRTLADAYGDHAVGVVLSGTGQNGTVGVGRIKERGGLVLAQDPDDAEFDEMPRSALSSGVVDAVATASALGREVIDYAERLHRVHLDDGDALAQDEVEAVRRILTLVRTRTGHDFAHYKRATVLRRLERRMHICDVSTLSDYFVTLREDPAEAQRLLDDLLIHVTNFFRDPETFQVLERDVIPDLFAHAQGEVRVWVAGCATGEEAYSLAILLDEATVDLDELPRIQVFATDLSGDAIQTARVGVYPESIEADVSPERLRRYFRKTSGGYRVSEDLRERVLFAPHSLLKDPPFARLDLVTCRNVLIYLQRGLQRRVLELFHYALRPDGRLFLGASETADAGHDLFSPLDKSARIYKRREVEATLPIVPSVRRLQRIEPSPTLEPEPDPSTPTAALHERMRAVQAAPSVLVDQAHRVVHLSDGVSPYLQLGAGDPTQSIIRLVTQALRPTLQTALFKSRRASEPVETGPVRLDDDRAVRLRVQAVEDTDLVLVTFLDAPPLPSLPLSADEETRVLAEELQETREQLQLTIEEFETSREELRAQNEELQSMNEELRSTAEELETSKEEAQSMAEELQTVNDELKGKVSELAQASGDLENLIASTEIATLFLDRELRIQWFTPHIRHHFHVRTSDIGRPLADLAQKFGGGRLVEDAEAVVERLEVQQREVQGEGGQWYLVQVRPYRVGDGRIEGVVVTFVDITERRRQEAEVERRSQEFQALVAASAQTVWTTDAKGRVVEDSPSWRAFTGQTVDEWMGEGWANAVHPDDRAEALTAWRAHVAAGTPFEHLFRLHSADGAWRWTRVRSIPLHNPEGNVRGWVGANEDVTDQHQIEAALRTSEARYRTLFESLSEGFCLVEMVTDDAGAFVDYCYLVVNPAFEDQTGLVDVVGERARETAPGLEDYWVEAFGRVATTGQREAIDGQAEPVDRWFEGEAFAVGDEAPYRVAVLFTNVTERRATETALRESEQRLRETIETVPDVLFSVTCDGDLDYVNGQFEALTGVSGEEAGRDGVWMGLIHPDERERVVEAWATAFEQGERFEARYRIRRADGSYAWSFARVRPVHDADNTVACWYGTLTDVDALTTAEQDLQTMNETLETRVAERSAQARDLAVKLTVAEQDERQRLAHVLHDDLQQQLYGASLILTTARSSDTEAAISRAEAILADAVVLARTLATDLSPTVLASDRVEDLALWLAERERDRAGLTVTVEADELGRVADPSVRALLYQALRELLFNVVKHAGTDRAHIRVSSGEGTVTVQVEDEGVGFDTDRPRRGGFGLASVRGRLELVGGHLDIVSTHEAGTRATVVVPSGTLETL